MSTNFADPPNTSTPHRRVPRRQAAGLKKSSAMILASLASYAYVASHFTPRLLGLFHESTLLLADVAIGLFILMLQVFWLFTCFYISQALFSFLCWIRRSAKPPPLQGS